MKKKNSFTLKMKHHFYILIKINKNTTITLIQRKENNFINGLLVKGYFPVNIKRDSDDKRIVISCIAGKTSEKKARFLWASNPYLNVNPPIKLTDKHFNPLKKVPKGLKDEASW